MSEPRLLTIPISHFCEKARWALERAGIPYREERHLQLFHRLHALRSGAGETVPVLLVDQQVIGDSTAIIRWVDARLPEDRRLAPAEHAGEIGEIERRLDAGLGVEGRRWMYSVVAPTSIPRRYGLAGIPRHERAALPLVIPLMRLYLRFRMEAGPDSTGEALAAVERELDWIEAMLADGRRYLVGDRFSSADLSFAALSAAFLMPDRYGVELPPPTELPAEAAATVHRLRERPAGRFAARLIAEERPWPPAGAAASGAEPII